MTTLQEFGYEIWGRISNVSNHWFVSQCSDSELTVVKWNSMQRTRREPATFVAKPTPRSTLADTLRRYVRRLNQSPRDRCPRNRNRIRRKRPVAPLHRFKLRWLPFGSRCFPARFQVRTRLVGPALIYLPTPLCEPAKKEFLGETGADAFSNTDRKIPEDQADAAVRFGVVQVRDC
jgi:hypothetical protein